MNNLGLKSAWMVIAFAVFVSGGCAQGSHNSGLGGNGEGASDGGQGASGGGGGSGASSTGGSGGDGTTSSTSTSSTSTSSTTTSSTSTTTTSGTCGAMQHVCNNQCFGNTPESGCLLAAAGCPPCPQPGFGNATCTAAGACDINCNTGYHKSGASCVCDSACCTDADCPSGQTCQGGACSAGGGGAGGGGSCDPNDCQLQCFAMCFIQMKVGLGTCSGSTCNCVCM